MTITDNRTLPTTNFCNIKVGEVFFSPETESFYIRTYTDCLDDKKRYNAADLSDGCLVCFDNDEEVKKVKANLIIANP